MMTKKSYFELSKLDTYEARLAYLSMDGIVGMNIFGSHRYLNQALYTSDEWKKARRKAIIRDAGCDLGIEGYDVPGKIIVHHMNPISIDDVLDRNPDIYNIDYLICCSDRTHRNIHYKVEDNRNPNILVDRKPNDTTLW